MQAKPIGIIHTPFQSPEGMPIQPAGGIGVKGVVEVFQEFRAGLKMPERGRPDRTPISPSRALRGR